MSNAFITENFLLESPAAVRLYHQHAAALPIVDYHCHLPPDQVAADRRFENLAQVWLHGDHYKWRAMRTAGVAERYCTGEASDWEKFLKWAEVVPQTLRNPLFHWTHLELKRPLGIDRLLNPSTAREIWDQANARLAEEGFSCRGIMRRMNVALVCTTDDPADDLAAHAAIAADRSFAIRVLPTWRPDRAMAVESPPEWNRWVDRLADAAGARVGDYDSFLEALAARQEFFHRAGCRLSDHGLETIYAVDYTEAEIRGIFQSLRAGLTPDADEALKFKSALLYELARMNAARGWVQQLHVGPLRNPNTRRLAALGPDTGFDAIADGPLARPLARFLDRLEHDGRLAKTILYNLNPVHNEVLAALAGSFQDGCTPGKIQWGAAWWFLDQRDGILRHLETLSSFGLLSRFVGMLTDSRSFLSYARHEYFRRILCNLLGGEIERGLLPRDFALVGGIVEDICYRNAVAYFRFGD